MNGFGTRRVLLVGGVLAAVVAGGIVLALVLTGGSDSGNSGISPSSTQPSSSTPSPAATGEQAIRAQAQAAYLKYWDVYSEALLKLDTSRLDEVLTGEALQVVTKQVEQQESRNQPVRIDVDHHIRIVVINAAKVSVDDHYIDNSVRLDPNTMKPIESAPHAKVHHTYTLELVSGLWKVSFIIGYK